MQPNLATQDRLAQLAKAIARAKELEEAQECENNLYAFVKTSWKYIDPAPFVGGWHIEALCEHLQAVNDGQIRRLLINVPPRTGKSSIVSVAWPAFTWLQQNKSWLSGPEVQFLFASYAERLSLRDSVKCRRLMESPWYQKHWGKSFTLTSDQNTKIRFENDRGGYRLATSVGGTLTGEGGSVLVVDDAHKADEAESELVRRSVIDWYDEVFTTRLNDPKTGAMVIVGQRVHEADISGHLIEQGNWVHMCLPMTFEEDRRCVTVLGWEDPREKEGELLCEGRYGYEELKEQQAKPWVWAGQFQQRPEPKGGGIILRDWWGIFDEQESRYQGVVVGKFPAFEYLVAGLDSAFTEKEENDPSALTIWGVWRDVHSRGKIMLVNAWQKRLALHNPTPKPRQDWESETDYKERCKREWGLVEWVIYSCRRFKIDCLLIEAKASGISVSQEIRNLCGAEEFGVQLIDPKGDKVARLTSVQHLFSEGLVYAPYETDSSGYKFPKTWAEEVIQQTSSFPKASHDDLVDTLSMCLRHLRAIGLAVKRQEYTLDEQEELRYRKKSAPLYGM